MFKYLKNRNFNANDYNCNALSHLAKGNEAFLQRMSLLQSLDIHRGCVNSVIWDDTGEYLLSGSDDQQLIISTPWNGKTVRKLRTSHRANIFSAKFIPFSSNNKIISCSGDGILIYTDLNQFDETYDCRYTCHVDTCYDVITIPSDPHSFFSCGEDGTVRWFDLRVKTSCLEHECKEDILLNMGRAVTAIAVNPLTHFELAVATQDSTIHVYDRRMLGTKAHDSFLSESNKAVLFRLKPQSLEGKKHRVTSLRYSSNGDQVLASYSSDYLYLFDTKNFKEVPLEGCSSGEGNSETDCEPTLKRLRLRGDWSDTGPQAVPQGDITNQAEDVGQARPTLQSTLMQRMTDILSRMLHSSSSGRGTRRGTEGGALERNPDEADSERVSDLLASVGDMPSGGEEPPLADMSRETSSAPPSIASPVDERGLVLPLPSTLADLVPEAAALAPEPSGLPAPVPLTRSLDVPESMFDDSGLPSFDVNEAYSLHVATDDSQPTGCSSVASTQESAISVPDFRLREPLNEARTASSARSHEESNHTFMDVHEHLGNCNPTGLPQINNSIDDSLHLHSNQASGQELHLTQVPRGEEACRITPVVGDESSNEATVSIPVRESGAPELSSVEEAHPSNAIEAAASVERNETRGPPSLLSQESGHPSSGESEQPSMSATLGEDEDDENMFRRRRKFRMAKFVDRVIQRKRAERMHSETPNVVDRFVPFGKQLQQYKGHRNARTMIKEACFWGDDYVMSGSDCGRVFVWDKHTGRLVMLWEADRHVVNCLQPHPHLPVLATSGIDYDVKLWAPIRAEPAFDELRASEIAKRNERLLVETRDTVTVPATFMIRMLATLNQLRRDRLRNCNRNPNEEEGGSGRGEEEDED